MRGSIATLATVLASPYQRACLAGRHRVAPLTSDPPMRSIESPGIQRIESSCCLQSCCVGVLRSNAKPIQDPTGVYVCIDVDGWEMDQSLDPPRISQCTSPEAFLVITVSLEPSLLTMDGDLIL